MLLHKVVSRTDVYMGPGPDGDNVWETTESKIGMYSDEGVDRILTAHGMQREDVRVQQIVEPVYEDQMRVIEIHYSECPPEQHQLGFDRDGDPLCLSCGYYA